MYNNFIDKEQKFYASINPKLFKELSLKEKVDFLFKNNYFYKKQKIYIFPSSKNTITDLIYPENPYFEFYWFMHFKGQTYHINEKILEEYYEYIKEFVTTIMSDHLLYETQFLSKLKFEIKKEKYLLKTYKKHTKLFYKNSLHELFTDERKMCGGFTGIEDYIKKETPETLFNFLTYESLKNPNALDNGIISNWARIVEINHILLLCSKELKKINYPDLFVPVEDPLSTKEMVSFGFGKIDDNKDYDSLIFQSTAAENLLLYIFKKLRVIDKDNNPIKGFLPVCNDLWSNLTNNEKYHIFLLKAQKQDFSDYLIEKYNAPIKDKSSYSRSSKYTTKVQHLISEYIKKQ